MKAFGGSYIDIIYATFDSLVPYVKSSYLWSEGSVDLSSFSFGGRGVSGLGLVLGEELRV